MPKKVLIILGHPDEDSFCAGLAKAYKEGATEAGAHVEYLSLASMRFDPILHKGYHVIQELEPDLKRAQELVQWAEHIVIVYPIWFGSTPALLKGFIDRCWLPGFAYKFREHSKLWDKLLKGRSAHLIVTTGGPTWVYKWLYDSPGDHMIKKCVLEFAGISPVRMTEFGNVETATDKERMEMLADVHKKGAKLR